MSERCPEGSKWDDHGHCYKCGGKRQHMYGSPDTESAWVCHDCGDADAV